jgi:hypothetical protein
VPYDVIPFIITESSVSLFVIMAFYIQICENILNAFDAYLICCRPSYLELYSLIYLFIYCLVVYIQIFVLNCLVSRRVYTILLPLSYESCGCETTVIFPLKIAVIKYNAS